MIERILYLDRLHELYPDRGFDRLCRASWRWLRRYRTAYDPTLRRLIKVRFGGEL